MKSPAERSIEALTWASVVIWLGFMLVTGGLSYAWLVLMVLGIILLSSAIYQRSRNWETSLAIWIFGIWMAVFSVIETVNEIVKGMNEGQGLSIDLSVYLGIALVSMGVASVLKIIQGPRFTDTLGGSRNRGTYDPQMTASGQRTSTNLERDYRPRIIQDDLNSGSFPAQGPRVYQPGEDWQPANRRTARTQNRTRQTVVTQQDLQADYDDPNTPVFTRTSDYRYDRARAQEPADLGAQHYDDLYDERSWDAPPQTQRYVPPAPEPDRPRSGQRGPAPDDLEARVEDIIRRSRERRNISSDDLPY